MMFACIQDCSVCPFQCIPIRPARKPVVEPFGNPKQSDAVAVPPQTTVEESSVTENGLTVVEKVPIYEVKKNIFGKEKVVRKE